MSRIIKFNGILESMVNIVNRKYAVAMNLLVNICLFSIMIYDVRITGITMYVKGAVMAAGCGVILIYDVYLLPFIFGEVVLGKTGKLNENTRTGLIRLAGMLVVSTLLYFMGALQHFTASNTTRLYTYDYKSGALDFYQNTDQTISIFTVFAGAGFLVGVYFLNSKPVKNVNKSSKLGSSLLNSRTTVNLKTKTEGATKEIKN
ncbi:hypothetical protein ROZALSC1DRAFT_25959 [Rozella allomycis CSF55]|uniref:Uncharacterized protein n=1 Tax=Rozella allomycis (strain CSF55) TaxID=988480 RepID=A0A4P9YBC8_ROZAC|nr:hypothetical protein ROZALSC1DRAFT_25959 [Rozella allomycis CSF55]